MFFLVIVSICLKSSHIITVKYCDISISSLGFDINHTSLESSSLALAQISILAFWNQKRLFLDEMIEVD